MLAVAFAALCPALARAERIKARVVDVDQRHSEVGVDVAGQRRRYHVEDRSLYSVLHRNRLVIIRAEFVGGRHTIVDATSAALEGRVEQVDSRHHAIVVKDAETHESRTFYFEHSVPRDLRAGQDIAYDVEERGSRDVITRWHRR
jgi:hypothetical protein